MMKRCAVLVVMLVTSAVLGAQSPDHAKLLDRRPQADETAQGRTHGPGRRALALMSGNLLRNPLGVTA